MRGGNAPIAPASNTNARRLRRPAQLPDPCFESTERRALHFQVNGYGTLAELVVSLYQGITSLNSEKL
jgi:hypothetical protein